MSVSASVRRAISPYRGSLAALVGRCRICQHPHRFTVSRSATLPRLDDVSGADHTRSGVLFVWIVVPRAISPEGSTKRPKRAVTAAMENRKNEWEEECRT
jgi:hypothetical protein